MASDLKVIVSRSHPMDSLRRTSLPRVTEVSPGVMGITPGVTQSLGGSRPFVLVLVEFRKFVDQSITE